MRKTERDRIVDFVKRSSEIEFGVSARFAGDASRVCFCDEHRKILKVRSPDVVGVISSEFDFDVWVVVTIVGVCLCCCHDGLDSLCVITYFVMGQLYHVRFSGNKKRASDFPKAGSLLFSLA